MQAFPISRGTSLASLGAMLALPLWFFAVGPAPEQPSPCGPTTTVQQGDTYFAISQRCDVSISFIEEANPGVDPYSLQVGQTLQLTLDDAQQAEPMPGGYQVQAGDTLLSIAAAFGTTIEAIIEANPGIDPNALLIGDLIMPPGPGQPPGWNDEDSISVVGFLTEEGVECQAMRGQDGQLYSLVGADFDQYNSGDLLEVSGTTPEVSICMQGTTIEVDDIRQLG